MSKIILRVALPIIIAGIFAVVVFLSLGYENMSLGFFIILGLVSIFLFSFGFAIGQNFAFPVRKILEAASALDRGDLASRVYLDDNKDEISELARVLNKIAEELEQSHQETERTKQFVDVKVRAQTKSLEETITALEQKIRNRTAEMARLESESEAIRNQLQAKEAEVLELKNSLKVYKKKTREPVQ